jgi:hypothetical protein
MLVTDILDLAELTGAAREIEDPEGYTLNQLLPNDEIEDVEYIGRQSEITRGVAQFRSWDAETPIGRRQATTTTRQVKLPPLGQKLVIGEYERILLQRAQGAQNGALVQQVYSDTRSNVQSIRSRMEVARGQVLTTGKFTLTDENNLTLEADFGVPAGRLDVAPAVAWSDPTSDLFGFLEQLMTTYADGNASGQLPGRFTTSRRVVNLARANQQVIRAIYGSQATEGRVTAEQLNQVLEDQGMPRFVVYNTKVAGVAVLPDDKIILTPTNAESLGRSVFGITVEALELVGSNAVDFTLADAPGITAVTLKDGDPARIWSKANATAMPALDDPTLLMTADVV